MTLPTLVIGGAGFIGAALVNAMLAAGQSVIVVGRRPRADTEVPAGADYIQSDYSASGAIDALLPRCGTIVDLAFATAPKTDFSDPLEDLRRNAFASVGLMKTVVTAKWRGRLLTVSSGGAVYGIAKSVPLKEDSPLAPVSPYGIAKLAVERYADMYFRLVGLDVVVVRPANAYGPGQRPFLGQGFVATAMGCVAQRRAVTVFGENGTVRDYIHVDDVASGMLAALRVGRPGLFYNLGSGVGRSNRDVLESLSAIVLPDGFSVETVIEPARGFDVPINVLDSAMLERECDWRPRVSFEDGLAGMWPDILRRYRSKPA